MPKSLLLLCLTLLVPAFTTTAHAGKSCGDSSPSTYAPAPGDHANSTQLEAARKMPASIVSLELNMCAGELRVERSHSQLLELHISSPGADRSLGEYLHGFDVNSTKANVDVQIPSNYHATVTLGLPAAMLTKTEVNLGAGILLLEASALGQGDREINLGAGNATVVLHGDRNYMTLKVNVGMGHFDDQRRGGGSGNMVVSREMHGTGQGEIEMNVGTGTLVLKPASE